MMKWLLSLLLLIPNIALAQANIAGLLFASNFANWNVPQGNAGPMSWSSPSFCRVTSGGVTFNAFTTGIPIRLVDTGNPSLSETVTPNFVNISEFGCQISAAAVNPHKSFYFATASAGLNEAVSYAGVALNQVIVTPAWSNLGGITSMITSAQGNANVTILDQRSSVIVPYIWSGSAYVAQSFGGGPPTGAASNGLTGTYPGPGLNSTAVANALNGQTIAFFGISAQSINTTKFENQWDADGFTPGLYLGVNQPPVTWVSGTDYPACQEVLYTDSIYYIATNKTNNTANPGTNSAIWWPLTQASSPSPTSLECGFYWALANAGSSTTGGSNAILWLSGQTNNGVYPINGPLVMPPKGAQVEILGTSQGDNGTPVQIEATAAMSTMILKPSLTSPSSTPYSLHLANVTLNGNGLAQEGFWFSGSKVGLVDHVHLSGLIGTSDWARLGDSSQSSGKGYGYQWIMNDVQLNSAGGAFASVTPVVTGGVLSITVNTPGSYNYFVNQGVVPTVHVWGTGSSGTSNQPCTVMGTATAVMSGSGLASITTSGFSGCGGTVYAYVPDSPAAQYGIYIDDITDSSFNDMIVNNVGTTACIVVNHSSNSFVHAHPYGCPIGIISNTGAQFSNTELDSNYIYGAQIAPADNWSNTDFIFNSSTALAGSKGFYTGSRTTFSSMGNSCQATPQGGGGWALVTSINGDIAHGATAIYPKGFQVIGQQCDDYSFVNTLPFLAIAGPGTSGSPAIFMGNGVPDSLNASGEYVVGAEVNHYAGNLFHFSYNDAYDTFTVGAQGNINIFGGQAASNSPLMITANPYVAGTGTTNFPSLYIFNQGAAAPTTFSTSGTELGINAQSGFTGHLIDLFLNGVSKWNVDYSGLETAGNIIDSGLTPGTAAICPNGTNGAFTTVGCGGSSASYYAGTATGLVNVLAATLSPVPASQAALLGIPVSFLPNLANTTTTPTVNFNSLGAQTIVKCGATALVAGDLSTTAVAVVIWNGTNAQLQNPQAAICQTGSSGAFTAGGTVSNGTIELISSTFRAVTSSSSVTYQGGGDNGSSGGGSGTFRGAQNNNSSAAGSASLEAGANTSTGQQGFANVQQSFTVASALAATFEAVAMTTTADQVQAAPLGGFTNAGIAQTVGGTGTQLFVVSHGKTTARFDGTPVIGDLACYPPASTGTIGLLHDNGSGSACTLGESAGPITGQVSGTGSGSTATVLLR